MPATRQPNNDESPGLAMTGPVVVYNPVKITDQRALRASIDEAAGKAGLASPQWLETTQEDPGFGQTREAIAAGAELIIVCGGDGTVSSCAAALADTGVAMALVPAGTGNLLARNLDLPKQQSEAVAVAFGAGRRVIDMARTESGQKFVVMAGLGFDASMISETNERTKARFGWPAYVGGIARALRGSPAVSFTIAVDEGIAQPYRAVGVIVGNVGQLQAGLTVLPQASPADGLLDLVVFAPNSWRDWPLILARLVTGRVAAGGRTDALRGAKIEIKCAEPLPLEFDGDLAGTADSLSVEAMPGALTVCVPA